MTTRVLYRYRTCALTGPWRPRRRAAADDAVGSRQAVSDRAQPDGIRWMVSGEIEEGLPTE